MRKTTIKIIFTIFIINFVFSPELYASPQADLQKAVDTNQPEQILKLLKQGMSLHSTIIENNESVPLLMWSVFSGHIGLMKYLLSQGADVTFENADGFTVLMIAAQKGNLQMVESLITTRKYNQTELNNALIFAGNSGGLNLVKYLLSNGANIKAKTDGGMTVLMTAVESGNLDLVKYLLSKGANLKAKTDDGTTVLMFAAEKGNLELVKYLILKGVDINAKRFGDLTFLHDVAWFGHRELVKFLVSKGANINAKDGYGATALFRLSERGDLELVKYLISKGADSKIKDRFGNTALKSAQQNGHTEVIKYLSHLQ